MIPRLIHRIWFGPHPMPAQYEAWWQAWRRQLPSYEFVTWRDEDIARLGALASQVEAAQGMARKADVARYQILRDHGGIYLDCDMMPLNYRDFSTESGLVVCHESPDEQDGCSIGFIAVDPGHPVLEAIVRTVRTMELNRLPPNKETGPAFFGRMIKAGFPTRLPTAAFYPYHLNESFSAILGRDLRQTFGIHVWGASWLPAEHQLGKLDRALLRGDLEEADQVARSVADRAPPEILRLIGDVRAIRQAEVRIATRSPLKNLLSLKTPVYFELIKTGDYLLRANPGAVVWQLGAGDGTHADPLRPLLVNHDPAAILLEPNPYVFARLTANYRNNHNAICLNVAFASENGRLRLHAVNPDKALALGAPENAGGLSSVFADRNALGGTAGLQGCVEEIDVEAVAFETLMETGGGREPDLVVADVEGMEAIALSHILSKGTRPRIVAWDDRSLPEEEGALLRKMLADQYTVMSADKLVLAYRNDFLLEYCNHLFIEYGIRTIFDGAISMMNGAAG